MYNCLLNYLTLHNILVDNQCGFREAHTTSVVLMRMLNDISNEVQNNTNSLGVLIDISNASDTANHKKLLPNMYHYDIRGIVLEWFKDYSANHTQ